MRASDRRGAAKQTRQIPAHSDSLFMTPVTERRRAYKIPRSSLSLPLSKSPADACSVFLLHPVVCRVAPERLARQPRRGASCRTRACFLNPLVMVTDSSSDFRKKHSGADELRQRQKRWECTGFLATLAKRDMSSQGSCLSYFASTGHPPKRRVHSRHRGLPLFVVPAAPRRPGRCETPPLCGRAGG